MNQLIDHVDGASTGLHTLEFDGTVYSNYSLEELKASGVSEAAILTLLKAEAGENISALTAKMRTEVCGQVDHYKLAGWNSKAQLALRVLSDTPADGDIDILQLECDQRGRNETPQELAQKQKLKAKALISAVATIDGMESAALKAIGSTLDESELAELIIKLEEDAMSLHKQLTGSGQ